MKAEQMAEGSLTEHVKITRITKDASFQVRNKVSLPTVERYAKSMKAGIDFDPIKLANVDGMLILVDGWHRLAAHERLGHTHVYAEVTLAIRREAIWMAASANLQHGLPLKSAELRNVFRAYVTSRQHLQGKGRLKSYREIGAELGKVACTRFRRHQVRCFNGTGGGSWRGGSLHASSSWRLCG